jgi:hypothetical protein
MGVRVTIATDHVNALNESIKKMLKRKAYVGIFADDPSNTRKADLEESGRDVKITNAEIGYINEFGEPAHNIPPRPFLIPAVLSSKSEIEASLFNVAQKTVGVGGDIDTALLAVGTKVQNRAKKNITESVGFETLAESTIKARRRKGFQGTKPLIVTGQLVNSIHTEVGD